MPTLKDFYRALFNCPGEYTCYSEANAKGTTVFKIGLPPAQFNFFSINPLDGLRDREPTESWHRPDRPRRADANVTAFRNILVEGDKISLDEQRKLIQTTEMPYTTATYSGGKSIHYIISLNESLKSRGEYDALVKRVYTALGGAQVVDVSNKNPSRLSRCPGAYRQDKQRQQKLEDVRSRIPIRELEEWLLSMGVPPEAPRTEPGHRVPTSQRRLLITSSTIPINLSPLAKYFLRFGADEGHWNNTLFKVACEMSEKGYNEAEIIEKVKGIDGEICRESLSTIKSAVRRVRSTIQNEFEDVSVEDCDPQP